MKSYKQSNRCEPHFSPQRAHTHICVCVREREDEYLFTHSSVSQARKRDLLKELKEGIGRKGGSSELRQVIFQFERPSAKYTLQEIILDPRKAAFLYCFVEIQRDEASSPQQYIKVKETEKLLQFWLEIYELVEHLKRYPAVNVSERIKKVFNLHEGVLSTANLEIDSNSSLEKVLSALTSELEESIMVDFRSSIWWSRMVAHLDHSSPFFSIPYCMFLYDKVLRDVFMMHLLGIGHQFWLKAWIIVQELVRPMLRDLLTDETSQEDGKEGAKKEEEGIDKLTPSEGRLIDVARGLWDGFLAPDSPCELSGLADSCPAVYLLQSMLVDQYTVRGYGPHKEKVAHPPMKLWNMIGEACFSAQSYIDCHLVQSNWTDFRLGSLYEMMCCTLLVDLNKSGFRKEYETGSTIPSNIFDDVWTSVDHGMLLQNLIRACKMAKDVSKHHIPVTSMTPSISGPRPAQCNSVLPPLTPLKDGGGRRPSLTTVDWLVQFESNIHDGTVGILRKLCIPVSDVAVSIHARQGGTTIPENLEPFLYPDLPEKGGHRDLEKIGMNEQPPPPELFSFVAPSRSTDGASFLGVCLLVHKQYFGTTTASVDVKDLPSPVLISTTSTSPGTDSLPLSHLQTDNGECQSNCDNAPLLLPRTERRSGPEYLPCGICILTEYVSFGKYEDDAQHRFHLTTILRRSLSSYFQEFKESILKEGTVEPSIMSSPSSRSSSSSSNIIHHHWSEMNSKTLSDEIIPFLNKKYQVSAFPDFMSVIRAMGPRHVCTIMTALLSEQKVVLISKSKAFLPIACDTLLGLLYPLSWKHVYLPLVPRQLASTLPQCPVPFFLGVPADYLVDESSVKIPDDVTVLDLDTGRLSGSFITPTPMQQQLDQLDDIHEELVKLLVPEIEDFYCLVGSCNKPEKRQQQLHSSDDDEGLELSVRLLFRNAVSKLLTGASECCVTIRTGTFESTRLFHESAFAQFKHSQGYKGAFNRSGLIQLFSKSQMFSAHICGAQ